MPPGPSGRRPASTGTASSAAREHLLELLAPIVARTGHDLEDVSVTSAGRRSLVRVIVDADDGVDLDAVAEISRLVSAALDDDAPGGAEFAGPFVLEVSSPGVDRPLVEPRHWRRAADRMVSVAVGEKTLTGRVVQADDDGVTLEIDGNERVVRWSELGAGRVQVEFNRTNRTDRGED